ncbi:AraC family transcriptional regulator [Streptomyces scabiei]|uniref:helix-turn-helix domain-containing protein n=1 Tax=Streptomyces scabiei TaxID=1930 RepID=UPI0029903BD7|nr:AraC family transcriptional regulator [Streptomyces scabiei]MDW8809851.1 AraC family transcriptional regulator [Streptomyces scabiei]
MKKNGQGVVCRQVSEITAVPFVPTPGALPGVEVIGFPHLLDRARRHGVDVTRSVRIGFHELITVRDGELRCSVDFTTYVLLPGSWLWVWPEQIVQFEAGHTDCDGRLVVFSAGFPGVTTDRLIRRVQQESSRMISPPATVQTALTGALDALEAECAGVLGLPVDARMETMRNLLSVILIRLAHLANQDRPDSYDHETFQRFRQAVEDGFARTHSVRAFATQLGYSERTLTRATQAAAGCGAKRYIDDRVLLEAKRLLAHTRLTSAAVGARVGFEHSTAFHAFFRRRMDMTPAEFRRLVQG